MLAAVDGRNGDEVREGEAAWLVGGEETRLISAIGAAAELSMSEVTEEEAAEGGHVAAPGVAYVTAAASEALKMLLLDQGADMGGKLWPPAPVKGMSSVNAISLLDKPCDAASVSL